MSVDYATLAHGAMRTQAEAILGVMVDAAEGAGWSPKSAAVTLARPGEQCNSLYVWVDTIRPDGLDRQQCAVDAVIDYRCMISVCMGAAVNETDAWWAGRVERLDMAWGVVAGLYAAHTTRTLCSALGVDCQHVTLGTFSRFDAGDMFTWEGTVSVLSSVR